MATNSVNTDWNSVLSTAQAGLASVTPQIDSLEAQQAPLRKAKDDALAALTAQRTYYKQAIEQYRPRPSLSEILYLEDAWKADPNNAAKKAAWDKAYATFQQQSKVLEEKTSGFEIAIRGLEQQYTNANDRFMAVWKQLPPLLEKEAQYKQQIAQAQASLGTQAKGTTPATTSTVSATTVPASNSPGNASIATTTTTTVVTSSNTVVTGTTTTTTTTTATNTNQATVDAPTDKPQSVYAFGDEIDDIYDPNLTPEQVASLSPGDQKARAAYLADNENFEGPPEEIVVTAPYAEGSAVGLSNSTFIAESTATAQDFAQFQAFDDWRVRLTLANDAQYLYRAQEPGILAPLASTDGVVFPYTPIIAVNYAANYEQTTITHSNYKIFQYSNSSVDSINITCDFTAQDTWEANYLLAVIHFFRSMTKMFYGQDEFPKNGTPPPLCYMFGLGGFQFEAHPLAITNFSYNLPNDVDYIRTTTTITSTAKYNETVIGNSRLPPEVRPGGTASPPNFDNDGQGFSPTYVPTKIQLAITCVPVMSRNAISNRFSLRDYATGNLLQGTKNLGGGIW